MEIRSSTAYNAPAGSKSNLTPSEQAAQQAEKDSQNRITQATQAVEEAERDEGQQLDHVKDEYVKSYLAETNREQDALAAQQRKGYEMLRDLKRAQDLEAHRVKRDGERTVAEIDNFYKNSEIDKDRQGAQELKKLQATQASQTDYEKKTEADDLALEQQNHAKQMQMVKENHLQQSTQLEAATRKEYDRLKAQYVDATEGSQKKFQDQFNATEKTESDIINALNSRAAQQVREIRTDTAGKLAAYGARQADPFYKLMDTQAELHETADAYIITARIPVHEQQHVSIGLRGNNAVLSGYRRNEENLNLGPGRSKGTAAYQSFNETFALKWPIESRLITKEFQGDTVIVTMPKKLNAEAYQAHRNAQVDHAPIERPHFPENIPYTKADVANYVPGSDGSINSRKRGEPGGSGTLT